MKTAQLIIIDEDKLLFSPLFLYILGEIASLGMCLLYEKTIYIILDKRYEQKFNTKRKKILLHALKIQGKVSNVTIIPSKQSHILSLKEIIEKHAITELQISENTSLYYFQELKKTLKKVKITAVPDFFSKPRIQKNSEEVKNIQKAIRIIEKVYLDVEKNIKKSYFVGKTEEFVSQYIQKKILDFAGEKASFPPIVAYGKNSAIPHHTPSKTLLSNGPLLIDMGCVYGGYCSDFTRSFWIGEKLEDFHLYKVLHKYVQEAYFIGEKAAISGKTGEDIDIQVRKYLENTGYGQYFTHGTGHGVGIQIHEEPKIKSGLGESIKLKKGMVFTIEPGLYIPNKFGIRLENIVFFDGNVSKNISKIPFKNHIAITNLEL